MFKKILLAIMIALPAMAFAQKFGVVNTNEIIRVMPEMAQVQKDLETASKTYEDEFAALQNEFQKKYTELQSMEESTPQAIRDRRVQEIQDLSQKIEQFRARAAQDLEQQQQRLIAPVQEKIHLALNAVGQEGQFTFIFENMIPVYVGSDVVDVTDQLKAKLGITE